MEENILNRSKMDEKIAQDSKEEENDKSSSSSSSSSSSLSSSSSSSSNSSIHQKESCTDSPLGSMNAAQFSTSIMRLDRIGLSDEKVGDSDENETFDMNTALSPLMIEPGSKRGLLCSTNTDPGLVSDEEDYDENTDPGVNSDDESHTAEPDLVSQGHHLDQVSPQDRDWFPFPGKGLEGQDKCTYYRSVPKPLHSTLDIVENNDGTGGFSGIFADQRLHSSEHKGSEESNKTDVDFMSGDANFNRKLQPFFIKGGMEPEDSSNEDGDEREVGEELDIDQPVTISEPTGPAIVTCTFYHESDEDELERFAGAAAWGEASTEQTSEQPEMDLGGQDNAISTTIVTLDDIDLRARAKAEDKLTASASSSSSWQSNTSSENEYDFIAAAEASQVQEGLSDLRESKDIGFSEGTAHVADTIRVQEIEFELEEPNDSDKYLEAINSNQDEPKPLFQDLVQKDDLLDLGISHQPTKEHLESSGKSLSRLASKADDSRLVESFRRPLGPWGSLGDSQDFTSSECVGAWSLKYNESPGISYEETDNDLINQNINDNVRAVVGQLVQDPIAYYDKDEMDYENMKGNDDKEQEFESDEEFQLSPLIEEDDVQSSDGEPWEDEDNPENRRPNTSFKATSGYLKQISLVKKDGLRHFERKEVRKLDEDSEDPKKGSNEVYNPKTEGPKDVKPEKFESLGDVGIKGLAEGRRELFQQVSSAPPASLTTITSIDETDVWHRDQDHPTSSSELEKLEPQTIKAANMANSKRILGKLDSFIDDTDESRNVLVQIEDLPEFNVNSPVPKSGSSSSFDKSEEKKLSSLSSVSSSLSSTSENIAKGGNFNKQDTLDSQDENLVNILSDENEAASGKESEGPDDSYASSTFTSKSKSSGRNDSSGSTDKDDANGESDEKEASFKQSVKFSQIWSQLPNPGDWPLETKEVADSTKSNSINEVQDEECLTKPDDPSGKSTKEPSSQTGNNRENDENLSSSNLTSSSCSSDGHQEWLTARRRSDASRKSLKRSSNVIDMTVEDTAEVSGNDNKDIEKPDCLNHRQLLGELYSSDISDVSVYANSKVVSPTFPEPPSEGRQSRLDLHRRNIIPNSASDENCSEKGQFRYDMTRNEDDKSTTDLASESEEFASSNYLNDIYENIKNSAKSDTRYTTPSRYSHVRNSSSIAQALDDSAGRSIPSCAPNMSQRDNGNSGLSRSYADEGLFDTAAQFREGGPFSKSWGNPSSSWKNRTPATKSDVVHKDKEEKQDIFVDTYSKKKPLRFDGQLAIGEKKKKSVSFEEFINESDNEEDNGKPIEKVFSAEDVFSDEEDAALLRDVTLTVAAAVDAPDGEDLTEDRSEIDKIKYRSIPISTNIWNPRHNIAQSTEPTNEFSWNQMMQHDLRCGQPPLRPGSSLGHSPRPDSSFGYSPRAESPLHASTHYYDGLNLSSFFQTDQVPSKYIHAAIPTSSSHSSAAGDTGESTGVTSISPKSTAYHHRKDGVPVDYPNTPGEPNAFDTVPPAVNVEPPEGLLMSISKGTVPHVTSQSPRSARSLYDWLEGHGSPKQPDVSSDLDRDLDLNDMQGEGHHGSKSPRSSSNPDINKGKNFKAPRLSSDLDLDKDTTHVYHSPRKSLGYDSFSPPVKGPNEEPQEEDDVFPALPRRNITSGATGFMLSRRHPVSSREGQGESQTGDVGVLPVFNDVEEEAEAASAAEALTASSISRGNQGQGHVTSPDTKVTTTVQSHHQVTDKVSREGHTEGTAAEEVEVEPEVIIRECVDYSLNNSKRSRYGDNTTDDLELDLDIGSAGVGMETADVASDIRRSRLLESLVRKQIKDPETADSVDRTDVMKSVRVEESYHSYGDALSSDREWDRDRDMDRYRERDRDREREREGRSSPIRDYRRDRDGRGSPVRGIRDRSSSPSRNYRDSHDGRSSPTRSYRDSSYPEDRPKSSSRDLDFQPIRSSAQNGNESSGDWATRNGSHSRASTSASEQELSRYFGSDSHHARSRSTPDPALPEKSVTSSLLESSGGRQRGIDRLSQILRRSNDRLADLDRDTSPAAGGNSTEPPSTSSRGRYSPATTKHDLDSGINSEYNDYNNERTSRDRDMRDNWDGNNYRSSSRDRSHDRSYDHKSHDRNHDNEYSDAADPYLTSSSNSTSQPPLKSALVTSRTTPVSMTSQRSTARIQLSGGKSGTGKEDSYRIQDLEDMVSSLKRLLKEREKEVDELKSHQRSLQAELHTVRNTEANFDKNQFQKKIDNLIAERENLMTEVWRLKNGINDKRCDELDHDRSGSPTSMLPSSDQLDHYDPNNPRALLRKIKDLEGQVQDLQEANETASSKLSTIEHQLEEAQEENRILRRNQGDAVRDLQEENALLKEQLESLRTEPSEISRSITASDGDYLQTEVRQLRGDLHHQRDRNHQLTQDNIKLTDYIRDLEAKTILNRTASSGSSTLRSSSRAGPGANTLGTATNSSSSRTSPTRSRYLPPGLTYRLADSDLADRYRKEDAAEDHGYQPRSLSPTRMSSYTRSLSPTRVSQDLRSRSPVATLANRNSDDLRFSNDVRKDNYMRTHNGITSHSSSNGIDYADRSGRAMSEKSDSTMYLATMPSTGLTESTLPAHEQSQREERNNVTSLLGQVDIKSPKVDMIDDLIDESPATPNTAASSRGSQHTYTSRLNSSSISSSTLVSNDTKLHDLSITSSKIQADVDDIDGDEFFLGPGNKTYKVSSSGDGSKYTEPFSSHTSKTYDDLSNLSITSTGKRPTDGYRSLNDSINKDCSSYSKSIQQSIDELSDDDDNALGLKGGSTNGHSEILNGTANGQQKSERRDSISSDSTDYILIQAEQHLKHGSSVLDGPVKRIVTEPPPQPPSSNKLLPSTGSSTLNTGNSIGRSASPSVPAYGLSSSLKPRSASATPSSRPNLLSSVDTLNTSGSALPSSSLTNLTQQSTRNHSPAFPSSGSFTHSGNRPESGLGGSKRPFAPRSSAEVRMEDTVKFTRQGGKISKGLIKYIGQLPGKNDTYLGIELEHEMGKHDGVYDGQRYFTCKPNRGVFVAFSRVVMAWSGS